MKLPSIFENGYEYVYDEKNEVFYRKENKNKMYLIKLINELGKEVFYESSDWYFSQWVQFYFSCKAKFGSPPDIKRTQMELWLH